MRAGFGICDITPPLGVELAGYGYYLGRRAQSVRDRLYVRALALSWGAEQLMLVCLDALGASRGLVDQLQADLLQHGLQPHQVMLLSSHTHTGPCLKYHLGCGELDQDYVNKLPGKLLAACEGALQDMDSVTDLHKVLQPLGQDLAYNRADPRGLVENQVRGLRIKRKTRSEICLVSYACHPVCLGRSHAISADFPGEIHRLLADRGMQSIYLGGLCGDIDPLPCPEADREAVMGRFSREITEAFLREARPLPLSLQVRRETGLLKLRAVSRQELTNLADTLKQPQGTQPSPQDLVKAQWVEHFLGMGTLPSQEQFAYAYALIGELALLALPFEGFVQTAHTSRSHLHQPGALVLGCFEELLGYLPSSEDIQRDGYAALESAFLYLRLPPQAGEAERLGKDIARQILMASGKAKS